MIPATEMGGDYYDIISTDNGTWILLGDVTGHGVGSAMVMFMVQSIMTTLINSNAVSTPAQLLYEANRILCQNMRRLEEARPLTIVALHTVDGIRYTYCGSHEPLLVLRKDSATIETLSVDHFPFGIGMVEEMTADEFGMGTFGLSHGDILYIGTDGITEAAQNGRYNQGTFGEDGLCDFIVDNRSIPMAQFTQDLVSLLRRYTNNTFHDDITLIAARAT